MVDEPAPESPGSNEGNGQHKEHSLDSQHGPDDATVIEQSHSDPERFALLFDRHAPTIHQYVARRLGPWIADDLVAETFTIAFRKRARYQALYRDARPWLYGIATRLISQHRRSEVRHYRALARTGMDPVIESHEESVATDVAAEGARKQLGAALANLSRKERDALLLHVWQELSYAEIATAMDVPMGTVRSRLNRARRRMRGQLGEDHAAEILGEEFDDARESRAEGNASEASQAATFEYARRDPQALQTRPGTGA